MRKQIYAMGWVVNTPTKKNKTGEAIKNDGGHSWGSTVLSRIIKQVLYIEVTFT